LKDKLQKLEEENKTVADIKEDVKEDNSAVLSFIFILGSVILIGCMVGGILWWKSNRY
jgi:uncharacterized Tic20 family protein